MSKIIKVVLVLVVVVLLAGTAAFLFLDSIVRSAVEKGATYATGVETKLAGIDVGLLSGRIDLNGLEIANPPGFRPEPFLRLDEARASWEGSTVLSNEIQMNEFALEGITVNIERTGKASNYGTILDNLKKLSKDGDPPPAEEPAGEARRLKIRRIAIRRVEVSLHLSGVAGLAGSQKVTVPELVIEDFDSSGSTTEIVSKLTRAVVNAVMKSAASAGKGIFPADLLQDLGQSLGDLQGAIEAAGKDVIQGLDSTIKDLGEGLGVDKLLKKKP